MDFSNKTHSLFFRISVIFSFFIIKLMTPNLLFFYPKRILLYIIYSESFPYLFGIKKVLDNLRRSDSFLVVS